MKPKEALKAAGFPVKEGQGRLSKVAIEKCKELAASGIKIDGYEVSSVPSAAPVVKKVRVLNGEKTIADMPPVRYDETKYKAVSETPVFGKTTFSMREVCQFCGSSLSYHRCDTPRVLGVPVRIEAR